MRSAATALPGQPEGAAAPVSCRLSVMHPPTPPPLPIGAGPGQAPSSPAPPRMDRPRGRGGSERARPAVSYGGGPAGGRALVGYLVARSLARAPSRRLWGSRGCQSGHRHRLAPTFSLVPFWLSPSLPRTSE